MIYFRLSQDCRNCLWFENGLRLRLGPPAELAFVRSVVAGELSIQNLASRDFERMTAVCRCPTNRLSIP
jgi:hypothetical protein